MVYVCKRLNKPGKKSVSITVSPGTVGERTRQRVLSKQIANRQGTENACLQSVVPAAITGRRAIG